MVRRRRSRNVPAGTFVERRSRTMASVRIWMCGGLRVEAGGEHVEDRLTRRKSRELLALLLDRDGVVAREQLIEALWPEEAAGSRDAALRQLLTEIRQCLGTEAIQGRAEVQLRLPRDAWVDVRAAQRADDECRLAFEERRWRLAAAHATAVGDLLAQEFLAGMNGPWIEERRRALEQVELGALEALAAAALHEPGMEADAARAAREFVARAPFRESGYALLMRASVATDNPAEALVVYERLRTLLREELGTTPSLKLSALHMWALEQADPDLPEVAAEAAGVLAGERPEPAPRSG